MNLKDGRLYETMHGRRFRVQYDASRRIFECPNAFAGFWTADGYSGCGDIDNFLVREVPEMRWVPTKRASIQPNEIYRWSDMSARHLQQQVTREEARRRDPNYAKAKLKTEDGALIPGGTVVLQGMLFGVMQMHNGKFMLIQK